MKSQLSSLLHSLAARSFMKPEDLAAFFQLMLLAGIALMLMLDCKDIAVFLARINVAYAGITILTRILTEHTRIFTRPSVILLTTALLAANTLAFDHYEQFYINLGLVIIYILILLAQESKGAAKELIYIISLPSAFTALHIIAVSCFCLNEYVWNAWYAAFIILSVWLVCRNNIAALKRYVPGITLLLLFVYAFLLIQMPVRAVKMLQPFRAFNYAINYDAFINTNNLAIYASLALIVSVYYFFKASKILKIFLALAALEFAFFILQSSWRPIWLGLILGSMFSLQLISGRRRLILIMAMLLLQAGLFTANVAHYGDRVTELAKNISTEERTIVWKDAWNMQKSSTVASWVYGHGLDAFLINFQNYPTTYKTYLKFMKYKNFSSPHNILLDVLYSSGILGCLLIIIFYYRLYRYFIIISGNDKMNRTFACTILAALTATLVSNGLNHGTFTMMSIFPTAFICTALIYLQAGKTQTLTQNNKITL